MSYKKEHAGIAYDKNGKKVAVGDYIRRPDGVVIKAAGFVVFNGPWGACHEMEVLSREEGEKLHAAQRGDDEYTILWGT